MLTLEEIEEKRRIAKIRELKSRIAVLANKLVYVTSEIKKFGPRKYGSVLKVKFHRRPGMIRHWHRMAKQSLIATRKKIYRLEAELKSL